MRAQGVSVQQCCGQHHSGCGSGEECKTELLPSIPDLVSTTSSLKRMGPHFSRWVSLPRTLSVGSHLSESPFLWAVFQ